MIHQKHILIAVYLSFWHAHIRLVINMVINKLKTPKEFCIPSYHGGVMVESINYVHACDFLVIAVFIIFYKLCEICLDYICFTDLRINFLPSALLPVTFPMVHLRGCFLTFLFAFWKHEYDTPFIHFHMLA